MRKYLLFTLILSLFLGSCTTSKKTVYLRSKEKEPTTYIIPRGPEQRIKPNDELMIEVTSVDQISFVQNNAASGSDETAAAEVTYSVDQDGYIFYPVLGKFYVDSMTLDKASLKMKDALISYYNQPQVRISYSYKTITVLGAVGSPGVVQYTRDQITIFELLAMAGDITETGNRKNVYLIRKNGNEMTRYNIDLTQEELVLTDYYYLHPEDVLYVKPTRSINWAVISGPVSLITSAVTATVLIINFMYSDLWQN